MKRGWLSGDGMQTAHYAFESERMLLGRISDPESTA